MTAAVLLFAGNIILLFVLLGLPVTNLRLRQSVLVNASPAYLWQAVWPLGANAGWSGDITGSQALPDGRIRTVLSWRGRDDRPVVQDLEILELREGEGFSYRVADDNTLDASFWSRYRRSVDIHAEGGRARVAVETTDDYRGIAFAVFRYFALRRELKKLKSWAETGEYRTGGLFEHPLTQSASVAATALIFSVFFGFTSLGITMAVLLTAVIVLHELGHVAAFRMMGHRKTRMIFLPLLGGIAIGGRPYDRHYEIAFSALMGAGFSAFLIPLAMASHAASIAANAEQAARAAVIFAGFCGLFNFANLLPIWRFDGGQVLRQLFRAPLALALVSFTVLASFLGIGWYLALPDTFVIAGGCAIAILSVLTRGRSIKPRHALTQMTAMERAAMSAAFAAVFATHGFAIVWTAARLSLT